MCAAIDFQISFINRKGGTVLIGDDGHQYYKLKDYKNGSSIWRCIFYQKSKCSGSLTVKERVILQKKSHVCEPNVAKNVIDIALSKLKEKVVKSDKPIPRLYDKAISKLKDEGLDIVSNMPSLSSVQHCLYDTRNSAVKVQKTVFTKIEEVQIPDKYYHWVLADYYMDGVRIILFSMPDVKEKVGEISEFFGDATFKACPPPFAELFTIIGDVGSTTETTKVIPIFFALLSDKKQTTYQALFDLIKCTSPQFKPKIYHCDFEIASINALTSIFPEVQIIGCYYHWHRCLWRKAKRFENEKCKAERRIVELCCALPHLPKEMVLEGWSYVLAESEHLNMDKFLSYLRCTWIKDKYLNLLSVYGMRHRTNNVLEGYHSKLNKVVNKNTVTVMRLLNELRKISIKSWIKINSKNNHYNKRRTSDIKNDDNIRNILMQLINGDISVGHALEKLR